ncbi:hypothetical protein MNBD_GAMMA21-1789 [hydrothermal vent metagenome]|uniref:Rhodanese domain-containing protein n=1 Tax=hydrothermal vent metagenome TaxID=652676 RepID=A0A3B0ZXQ9_9ZZZZ
MMKTNTHKLYLSLVFMLVSFQSVAIINDEFPVRKLYPAVPVISLEDFHNQFNKVIVVDVRSAYEFETLRIVGAINIPLASSSFIDDMKKLRNANPNRKIIVYCNGKTCKKSYKATQRCRDKNIGNVIAFDAGIFDWTKKYPGKAVLLGKTPADPAKLISKSDFRKKLRAPDDFEKLMLNDNTLVLDIRDGFQREAISLFPGVERRVSLDDRVKLNNYITKAARQNQTLLIYDAAGKQVRWLMYYLESKGVKNYKFMKGGANAYFKNLRKQFVQ